MTDLETLNFTLQDKYRKLKSLNLNTFTLNKEIEELINEISDIEAKIKIIKDKTEDNE